MKNLLKTIALFFHAYFLNILLPCKVSSQGFAKGISVKSVAKKSSVTIGKRARLNTVSFTIGENGAIFIDGSSRLNNVSFHLPGSNAKVCIGSCCMISNTEFWIEDDANEIIIGDNTYIGGAHLAVTGKEKKIRIGKDSMLSNGIVIRTGDSHSIIDLSNGEKMNPEQNVFIGNHVWIAQNVTILKGSTVNDDSVIGCCSVVCNSFEHNSLIVGSPAKTVKEGICWNKERFV